jgi:hypothetical protein
MTGELVYKQWSHNLQAQMMSASGQHNSGLDRHLCCWKLNMSWV